MPVLVCVGKRTFFLTFLKNSKLAESLYFFISIATKVETGYVPRRAMTGHTSRDEPWQAILPETIRDRLFFVSSRAQAYFFLPSYETDVGSVGWWFPIIEKSSINSRLCRNLLAPYQDIKVSWALIIGRINYSISILKFSLLILMVY